MAVKICLDAGHYAKYNRCPAIPEYYESEMVWKLHLYLKEELEQRGFVVITTREDPNKDLALYQRGYASRGCDLFLSLHSNAIGSGMTESKDYPVACVFTGDETIAKKSQDIGWAQARLVAGVMETQQGGQIIQRICDRNGDGLVAEEYYGVLYGARCAGTCGVILEHSFHTNTRSVRWLLDDDNLRRLAWAEAEWLASYFGVTKQEEVKEEVRVEVNEDWQNDPATYRILVGVRSRLRDVVAFRLDIAGQGWVSYTEKRDGVFRVYIGKRLKRTKAEKTLAKLKGQGFNAVLLRE